MNTKTSSRMTGKIPGKSWLIGWVAATFLLGSVQAFATPPAAGTLIKNQATASYTDANNATIKVTSNEVQTTVQQVGALTLTASTSASGAAGATVYISHVLTNTGNGKDTFNVTATTTNNTLTPQIFLDADGDGKPDSNTVLTFPQSIDGGARLQFVVAYPIPTTTWTGETATITATAVTTSLYTTSSVTNTDTLSLATGAAFSVKKSFTQPAVSAVTAWNPALSNGQVGTKTVFTLSYTNNGLAGPLYIKDVLPAGFTYSTGSAVWSSMPGTALIETGATPQTAPGSGGTITYKYDATSGTIEAFIANVGANVSGTISFNVTVASAAKTGTSTTNNIASYNTGACSSTPTSLSTAQTACTSLTATNAAAFDVSGTYGVTFGVADPSLGTPATTGDTVTVASAVPGRPIYFTQTVTNTGNDTDTFNLISNYSGFTSTFPAGTTFTWLASDKATPLLDNNSDGVTDTGPLDPGATKTVVLQVLLPGSTAVNAAANYTVHPEALSVKDNTKYDLFIATLTAVSAGVVDLTNNPSTAIAGDLGAGPGTAPAYTVSGTLGSTLVIPLTVSNSDTGSLTFNLSASQTTSFPGNLPAGWTVTFSTSASCASGTSISQVTVGAASSSNVYACVAASSSAAATTAQSLYFKAVSTASSASTGTIESDILFDAVTLTAASTYKFTVDTTNTKSVTPGATVDYSHTVNNTGSASCFADGNFRVNITGLTTGWTASVYLDNDNSKSYTTGDTSVTSTGVNGSFPLPSTLGGALASGKSFSLLVRVFAPAGATIADQSVITVIVTDNSTAHTACVLDGSSPTDTTNIVTGQVRVSKMQAADTTCAGTASSFTADSISLKPGQCVVYQVIAKNEGSTPVTDIGIADTIPANTNYTGATQPSNQCVAAGLATGTVAYTGSASGLAKVATP